VSRKMKNSGRSTRTITRQVPQSQRRLTLHLQTRRIHQPDQVGDEFRLAQLQLPPVFSVDGDVAESGGAVILNVRIGAGEKVDENGDRTRRDELLSVLVGVGHVEQCTGSVPLNAHVFRLGEAGEGVKGAGASNTALVLVCSVEKSECRVQKGGGEEDARTVGSQVGDASDGVALNLNVGRKHLTDKGLEAAELDDGELVLGCLRQASVHG
jgi:hypothetical protein